MKPMSQDHMHARIDLHGRPIEIGTKVRSHDYAFGLKGRTTPAGMDREGDMASYVEGVVAAIGEIEIEGCPRYTVRPFIRMIRGRAEDAEGADPVHPPLNGTRSTMGGVTCGVEVIEVYDEWDQADDWTWYATAPETELAHFWQPETIRISAETDGFWLSDERAPGEGRFDTLQEAKDSRYWTAALAYHQQRDLLQTESELPAGWLIDLSDGITFDCGSEQITGCMSSDRPTWNAWTEKGQVPGDHPTPGDALAALERWKAGQMKSAT